MNCWTLVFLSHGLIVTIIPCLIKNCNDSQVDTVLRESHSLLMKSHQLEGLRIYEHLALNISFFGVRQMGAVDLLKRQCLRTRDVTVMDFCSNTGSSVPVKGFSKHFHCFLKVHSVDQCGTNLQGISCFVKSHEHDVFIKLKVFYLCIV